MLVVERVEHLPPRTPRPDQAHPAKQAQLMGDRRLADTDERGNVADAELTDGQHIEDPDARRVAEDAEGGGNLLNDRFRQEPRLARQRLTGIKMNDVAVFSHMNI